MSRVLNASPVRSMLDAAGVSIAEMARRLGVAPSTVSGYCDAGAGVRLSTLFVVAKECGGHLRIHWTPTPST